MRIQANAVPFGWISRFASRTVALAVAAGTALPVTAADLTVAQGDSLTVSADAAYEALVVNGSLAIAPNVTVTCTSLTVADGIGSGNTATLAIGDGATLQANVTDNFGGVKIARDSGRAEILLGRGATFSTTGFINFCYGYSAAPTSGSPLPEALLVVGTNATVHCGKGFFFGHNWNNRAWVPTDAARSSVQAVVRLDEGAVLSTRQIVDHISFATKIQFNGGRVVGRVEGPGGDANCGTSFVYMGQYAYYTSMYFEGLNGNPIAFDLAAMPNAPAFFARNYNSDYLYLTGDGGFVKTGSGVFPLTDAGNWNQNSNLRFLFSGDMVLKEGGFSVATAPLDTVFRAAENNVSRPVDVVVGNAGTFDLAGCNVVLNSVTAPGGGLVTNSAAGTATMTLGVRDGSRPMTLARAFPGIAVAKQGASAVTLCGEAVDSLSLQAGSLAFQGRKIMGYPFYRILFDEIKAGRDGGTHLYVREFAWLHDGEDVTRPYAKIHYNLSGTSYANSPEALFDENFDDYGDFNGMGYYDDPRAGHTDDWKHNLIGATIEFEACRPVDSYRWAPIHGWGTPFSDDRDPRDWHVFGGFSATTDTAELTLLDQVTGFFVTGVTAAPERWTATNFVCRYDATETAVGSLTLAADVPLSVDGASVSVSSVTAAAGVPVTLAHGAELSLPADEEIASLAVDVDAGGGTLANFRPARGGSVYLTGTVPKPRRFVIPVRIGTLLGDNLPTWRIFVNGREIDQAKLFVNEDGFLQTEYIGATVLVVK